MHLIFFYEFTKTCRSEIKNTTHGSMATRKWISPRFPRFTYKGYWTSLCVTSKFFLTIAKFAWWYVWKEFTEENKDQKLHTYKNWYTIYSLKNQNCFCCNLHRQRRFNSFVPKVLSMHTSLMKGSFNQMQRNCYGTERWSMLRMF